MNTKKIKELMDNAELTRHQIAQKVGVNHSVIYKIYNGSTKEIKISTAFKLADALGVDINEFREDEENE